MAKDVLCTRAHRDSLVEPQPLIEPDAVLRVQRAAEEVMERASHVPAIDG